jgi:hypothetical protein
MYLHHNLHGVSFRERRTNVPDSYARPGSLDLAKELSGESSACVRAYRQDEMENEDAQVAGFGKLV